MRFFAYTLKGLELGSHFAPAVLSLTTLFLSACAGEGSQLSKAQKLDSPKARLAEMIYFHGSSQTRFDPDHPDLPTTDAKYPGGPAWFAMEDPKLSIWRSGQLLAGEPDEIPAGDSIFLHAYKLKPETQVLDARSLTAADFYLRYVNPEGNVSNIEVTPQQAAKAFFEKFPNYDAYLITDWISGDKELIVKDPAKFLESQGPPVEFKLNAEYSCTSCAIERYVFDSNSQYGSYGLVPSLTCTSGYAITKL